MGGWRRLLAAWGVVLALGACSVGPAVVDRSEQEWSSGATGPVALWPPPSNRIVGESSSTWWAGTAQLELSPTGLEVVARPAAEELVVDGSGQAWLRGPWHLVRIDPSTGAAETWDVGDDAAFGSILRIRGSAQPGVWLVLADRILLFDGVRFLRDVPVPAEYRGGPDGEVADLVEVGTEVWIASRAGVARWTGAAWGLVRPDQLTAVRVLAVDTTGAVWAAGWARGDVRRREAVVRLDAAGWAEPSREGAPRVAHQLVAHPTGGVVAMLGSDVRWFDGTSWQAFPPAGMSLGIGELPTRALTITGGGVAWLVGERGLARAGPDGWTRLPAAELPPLVAVASAGEDVLLAGGFSLHRLAGDAIAEVWSEQTPGPVATQAGIEARNWWGDSLWPAGGQVPIEPEGVAVVTADEVWSLTDGYPFPFRYSGGAWQEVSMPSVQWAAPVVATDGAVWLGTSKGLVRVSGETRSRITSVASGRSGRVGPGGSIFVLPSEWYGWWYADGYADGPPDYLELQRIEADGTVSAIPLPVGRWWLSSVVAGPDGIVWATSCASGEVDVCPTPSELFRWDGRWAPVAYPGSNVTLIGLAGDGALWARIDQGPEPVWADGGDAALARYVDGRWTTLLDTGVPDRMVVTPGGAACGIHGARKGLVCVDASGETRRWSVGMSGDLRVGLDGSAWLAREGTVVRLPLTVAD